MPAGFDKCVNNGGRVRTVKGPNKKLGVGAGEYVHFCFLNGKSYRGHTKKKRKGG